MASTENINSEIDTKLGSINKSTDLSISTFDTFTNSLYEILINHSVGELSESSISKIIILSQKINEFIQENEKGPTLLQCQHWKLCIEKVANIVLFPSDTYVFRSYYNGLVIIGILEKIITITRNKPIQALIRSLGDECTKSTLLSLKNSLLVKIRNLLKKCLSLLGSSGQTNAEYLMLSKFIEEKIKPIVGFDPVLLDQEIWLELNTLSTSFDRQPIDIKTAPDQNDIDESRFQGLMLNNYHIKDLKLDLNCYGFTGSVVFELGFDQGEFPEEYQFLYQNKPLAVRVFLKQTYSFPDPESEDEDDNYQTEVELLGVAHLGGQSHLRLDNPVPNIDLENETESIDSVIPTFSLQFSDPLTLWKPHKPNYFASGKSYAQIVDDNLFFQALASIDYQQSDILTKTRAQLAIFTEDRSFYDLFIDILAQYQLYLIYDYQASLQQGTSCYVLLDKLTDDNSGQAETAIKLTGDDLSELLSIDVSLAQTWSQQSGCLNASLEQNDLTQISSSVPEFQNMLHHQLDFETDNQLKANLYQSRTDRAERRASLTSSFELNLKAQMPNMAAYPSYFYYNLDNEQWESTIANLSSSVQFRRAKIHFQQTLSIEKYVRQQIDSSSWDSDGEEVRYEKIRPIRKSLGISHTASVQYLWQDKDSELNDLPHFSPFSPLEIPAQIVTAETVDDNVRYGYKFFLGQSDTESSYADDHQAQDAVYSISGISEKALTYAVRFPAALFTEEQTPLFYLVASPQLQSLARFDPLRNGDKVIVSIFNTEKMEISYSFGSSVVIPDKASEQLVQTSKFGAQQECEITCSQNGDKQAFQLKQTNSNDAGSNSISFSNDNDQGLVIAFSDEKE
ncbi:hypothetical protein M9194_06215 [Vibrio sp. S4M6]|uniref:hypothetical protein n=1 Tax=Vibrio sinus TaxID=2946865 RepID=UPI00202ABA95|nr:hypothetical protein [Vibrio sinus]MCL9781018.1 hypothetical protein [Vibrio sinus]